MGVAAAVAVGVGAAVADGAVGDALDLRGTASGTSTTSPPGNVRWWPPAPGWSGRRRSGGRHCRRSATIEERQAWRRARWTAAGAVTRRRGCRRREGTRGKVEDVLARRFPADIAPQEVGHALEQASRTARTRTVHAPDRSKSHERKRNRSGSSAATFPSRLSPTQPTSASARESLARPYRSTSLVSARGRFSRARHPPARSRSPTLRAIDATRIKRVARGGNKAQAMFSGSFPKYATRQLSSGQPIIQDPPVLRHAFEAALDAAGKHYSDAASRSSSAPRRR